MGLLGVIERRVDAKLARAARATHDAGMDRRRRRSSDFRTAIHLFLESQRRELGARSMRVTTAGGRVIAAVGDDAYVDEWTPTWMRPVDDLLLVASAGGRPSESVAAGVRRNIRTQIMATTR